ncbi:hypothetical protein M3Y94_01317600 [Aphelenchoides besseyi]|nr:hypothetical protein M3Y94_01317600 [Aphelenchoides besseyi]KAI6216619.1 hypothetical protein M3Y95_01268500 [Aphelenchoides besseyi]
MLHEKPVLVAFAVTQRPTSAVKSTLPLNAGARRTISPAAASTSSTDSAIGTTSPSSASSVSPAAHDLHNNGALLHVAFAIQPDDSDQGIEIVELNVVDLDTDIAQIAHRIGPQALLIATTEDLRQVLHPIAALHATRHCNVGETMDSTLRQRLPPVFNQFVSVDTLPDNRHGAEHYAQMSTVDRCRAVLDIVNEKNLDLLNHVETINEGYIPYVNFDRRIDSSLVVRTRGLPWQASDEDIALFFSGLNIAPGGIALCLGSEGRRNGESLVCFECNAHRELALRRHRNFLHNRYIEVYRSTGEEFLRVAVGSDSEALRFVCRDAAMIIRMRGLPFDCTENEIREFFGSDGEPGIMDDGVMFVNRPDGRPTGDAFVLFVDDEAGRRALTKHKNRIGIRYIELFRTTQAEVQQIINRIQQRPSPNPTVQTATGNGLATPIVSFPTAVSQPPTVFPANRRDCLRMRGLPYEAKPEQIAEFLGPHAKQIVDQGIHMIFNNQGTPSGEAFIQMKSEVAASLAAMNTHNKNMEIGKKKRYIEVFQCSLDEMSGVLNPLASLPNQIGLGLNAAQLLQLANAGLLPGNLGIPHQLAALRGIPPTSVYAQAPLSQANNPHLSLPLGFPNAAIANSGHQLNLFAGMQNFAGLANGAGQLPQLQMFGNDPHLYAPNAQIQQQMMLDAAGMYPQLPVMPGFDLAAAAAALQQAALVPTGSQR